MVDTEKQRSLEIRLNERLGNLADDTNNTAHSLLANGASERSLAAFASVHEYLNRVMGSSYHPSNSAEFERYMVALQDGMRGMMDALVMGRSDLRRENQSALGENSGALVKGIRSLIQEITPGGDIGPQETRDMSETNL